MGNGTLGNGTFQNVSGEMGHFYYLGNGTFYALGKGTLYSLGNGKFYPLGTILSSGNRDTYPLGIGPLILWDSGHPLGNGTWETGHAILWESGIPEDKWSDSQRISGPIPRGKNLWGARIAPSLRLKYG